MFPDVPEAAPSTLRLACASAWPCTGSPLGHLLALRKRLLRAVTEHSVRVAVLHRAQWLLHWIEGPPGAVDMAWQRVQRMPELRASRLLHRSVGAPGLREALHIAAVFRNERPDHVGRHIAQLADAAPFAEEPARIWHALAAPGAVPPCASIVLASAREHDDVDLLRRMVQRHGGEVVYRRFACADPALFDSGAAYADFTLADACNMRMHVLSRRCLRNEMVLRELTGVRDVVLLLGGRPASCHQLAQSAIELLRMRGGRDRIHLLANDPAQFGDIEALLRDAVPQATVRACVVEAGAREADYLEAALASLERDLPDVCPSWRAAPVPLAA